MEGAIDELVGNNEIGGLVLFLQRADSRDRNDALHPEFFERVNIRAEVQFRGQNAMAAAMPREKGDFAAFQFAQDEGIRWIAERRLHAHFVLIGKSGHGIEPAAADDANFRLEPRPAPSTPTARASDRSRLAVRTRRRCDRKHLSIKGRARWRF